MNRLSEFNTVPRNAVALTDFTWTPESPEGSSTRGKTVSP